MQIIINKFFTGIASSREKKVGILPSTCHRAGMKRKSNNRPIPHQYSLLRQILNFILDHLVPQLARECGVDRKARSFTPWSHVVALVYAQLTHAIGVNDVCDVLRLHSGALSALRGAKPTSRNSLSHATSNKML